MRVCGMPKDFWRFAEAFWYWEYILTSTYQQSHMKPLYGFFDKWRYHGSNYHNINRQSFDMVARQHGSFCPAKVERSSGTACLDVLFSNPNEPSQIAMR